MFNIPFLETDAGRVLFLSRLHQEPTYDGLLEGIPTRERNESWCAQWQQRASREFAEGHAAVVLAPPRTGISAPSENLRRHFEGHGAALERIPRVTCVAVLESHHPTAAEPREMCSSLAVVWFQDALAMPLDPRVEEALKALDWDAHAWSWSP